MGIRLEHILVITIILMVGFILNVKVTDIDIKKRLSKKELEFTDTTFIETDTSTLHSIVHSTYGVRENGALKLEQISYHSDNIDILRARLGRYDQEKIFLDGDVFMRQKEGFEYSAEHAVYDKNSKILEITSPFTAKLNENTIKGTSLVYDTVKKEASAMAIDAIVYTVSK
ncbi:MAG: hypothetical protein IE885_01825 [Campylobacterales bacterium]|nr:hypothetical protein [Campylobacterales bacterium]